MKREIIIKDSDIISINRSKKENQADSLLYRDKKGKLHIIDFEFCAKNYRSEKGKTALKCVGERNIDELYFRFYTSGLKTKIIFKKNYIASIMSRDILRGTNRNRFLQLQNFMDETKYKTTDLSMH